MPRRLDRKTRDDRAEHRDHEGRQQIADERHGADRNAELVPLDRVLHHHLREAGHGAEAEPDHDQQHLEPDQADAVDVPGEHEDRADRDASPAIGSSL